MYKKSLTILLVDDEKDFLTNTKQQLESLGYAVRTALSGDNALKLKDISNIDVAIIDKNMPGINGLDTGKKLRELNCGIVLIMLTAHWDVESTVKAIRDLGFHDYLTKPIDLDTLKETLTEATGLRRRILGKGEDFVSSKALDKVMQKVKDAAECDVTVLITGESGTGKELVAKAIHNLSLRKYKPFVAVQCSALTDSLLGSELFGHKQGAFTDAKEDRPGYFSHAKDGTIFLDEIGDASPTVQVGLLRVLRAREYVPVGGVEPVKMYARVLVATNRDLGKLIEEKKFREDLFYRLNVMPIEVPPLRDRKEDIPSLIDHFIARFNRVHRKKVTGITEEALAFLKTYSYPGNVAQLENCIEHAVVRAKSGGIRLEHIPENIRNQTMGIQPCPKNFNATCISTSKEIQQQEHFLKVSEGFDIKIPIPLEKAKEAVRYIEDRLVHKKDKERLGKLLKRDPPLAFGVILDFYKHLWPYAQPASVTKEFFSRVFIQGGKEPHRNLAKIAKNMVVVNKANETVDLRLIQRKIAPKFWMWCEKLGITLSEELQTEIQQICKGHNT